MYLRGTMNSIFQLSNLTDNALSYNSYLDLIDSLLAEGKTTGNDNNPSHLEKAPLNRQRMKRLDKVAALSGELIHAIESLPIPITFIVITEGWCGDSAQNLPYIHKIAEAGNGKIKEFYFLRDENPELMNQFLTNGGRAIPKLIAIHSESREILFTWGPRPTKIQEWHFKMRTESNLTKDELGVELHQLYTKNKGEYLQEDFLSAFNSLAL
jgi:thioredoxin-like negative regulator of GroEL